MVNKEHQVLFYFYGADHNAIRETFFQRIGDWHLPKEALEIQSQGANRLYDWLCVQFESNDDKLNYEPILRQVVLDLGGTISQSS